MAARSTANARTVSDKVLAASTHVVRHNHRGTKNRGPYSLQFFESSTELLQFTAAAADLPQ